MNTIIVFALIYASTPGAAHKPAEPGPCELVPDGDVRVLVAGAQTHWISVAAREPCPMQSGEVSLESANLRVRARLDQWASQGGFLVLESELSTTMRGDQRWQIVRDNKPLATINLPVAGGLAVHPQAGVHYLGNRGPVERLRDLTSEPTMSSGTSGSRDELPIAVVGPTGATERVTNIVTFDVPAGLPADSTGTAYWALDSGSDSVQLACINHQGSAQSTPPSKTSTATMALRLGDFGFSVADTSDEICVLPSIQEIAFSVSRVVANPIVFTLRLLQNGTGSPLFETRAKIAALARIESLPYPIANHLEIICDEKPIHNMMTLAIPEEAIGDGSCKLKLSEKAEAPGELSIGAYGPQMFDVEIAREGTNEARKVRWVIPDLKSKLSLSLPSPPGERHEGEVYVVTVRSAATLGEDGVVYRSGTVARDDSSSVESADMFFRARLRPRGTFGFASLPVRVYMTVPVSLSALRFPASERSVRSSADSVSVELLTVQAGLLLTVEPWDYNRGRSKWAFPVRFQTGFNFLSLGDSTEQSFSPSFLLGASVALPIVEAKPHVGTSVAVGIYYEADFRERYPFRDGSALLMTLGFNVFTLLAPPEGSATEDE
ncbi:MAG: hypothetical protein HYV07_26040 [Deltaproteobacteria bacterium]|nr:hypothetical protein [Deltaproteobacteria bacterium]